MKFPYSTGVVASPTGDDFFLIRRPEIPITIFGENGSVTCLALVDTGSDNTIFPKSVADYLDIRLEQDLGPSARSYAGHQVQLLSGIAQLQIETEDDRRKWSTPICFFEFDDPEEEAVVLGHSGFLEYFTATFDGKACVLSLEPNNELPDDNALRP